MKLAVSLITAFFALASAAEAHVTHVDVLSRTVVAGGAAFGKSGPYEKIVAKAYFSDAPGTPANAPIVDLDRAPRNASGNVESATDVVILRPVDIMRGNGSTLVEIPNRGGKGILRYLNHAKGSMDPQSAAEFGDGFLMNRGFTVAWIGWQWDTPPGNPLTMRLTTPVVTDRGVPITGPVRSDFVPATMLHEQTVGDRGHIPYPVANPDDAANVLTVRDAIRGERRVVPRSAWRFARWQNGAYVPNPAYIAAADGFAPGHIYELVYTAKNPVVTGLGFAAVRDVISYLKHDPATLAPTNRALGFGISQSGRFLRHMLYEGFNSDENGALVFDGIFADVAGAGRGSFNHRFAQPSRDGPSSSSFFYPTDIFPFTDTKEHDPFGHADDGLLTHHDAIHTPVKIMYSFGAYEYWSRAASLTTTTPDGAADVVLPDDVRVYAFAGTQHNPGIPTQITDTAQQPTNPDDFSWSLRALIVDLDAWAAGTAQPPASRYPTIAHGTLVPLDAVRFPAIPGVRPPKTYHHAWAMDFGPNFVSRGIVTNEPPTILGEYAVRLPQVDADGNDLDGIRMPEVAVPLGTYTGWNYRRPAIGLPTEYVDFTGMFLPFATDAASRVAGDPRAPIATRYRDRTAYMNAYMTYARVLARDGYLLPDDLGGVEARAAALWQSLTESHENEHDLRALRTERGQ